jgi:hypothetical protein
MNLDNFDLVASLQALPETNPVEIDGIQFGIPIVGGDCQQNGGGDRTCFQACCDLSIKIVETVCILAVTACH